MKIRFLLHITCLFVCTAFLDAADVPGWGESTSPLGDVAFTSKDGRLEMKVPGTEKPHGLTAELGSMDAPRILRPVRGDFTMQIKVDGMLQPGEEATEPSRTPYQAGGLVVMLDNDNYVTLVRAALQWRGAVRSYANFEIRNDGKCEQIGDARVRPLTLDRPAYLRLARKANQFFGWVSDDGENWEALPQKTIPATWGTDLQAGVVAISNSRNDFSPAFSGLRLEPPAGDSQAAASEAPENPFPYQPSADAEDCAGCKRNLEKIAAAILAYRKDHKDIPNWLSELVPKYLPDASVLLCPVTKKTGRLSPYGVLDPTVRCSYLFEFSPVLMPTAVKEAFDGPRRTNREWKRQQMGIVGTDVPIVRCLLHQPVLNLSYGGRIYESPLLWEENFMDITTREALSPH